MVCDILWPLHQLLDVFWCLKCFESGLPCTGDTGQKKHHQSPGCQRERHSTLAFWDSSCPLRSCSVTFHVSASWEWLTQPEVVRGHWQVLFCFKFKPQQVQFFLYFFFVFFKANVIWSVKLWKWNFNHKYCNKRNILYKKENPTLMKSLILFIQQEIMSIDITGFSYPLTLSPPTNRSWSTSHCLPL